MVGFAACWCSPLRVGGCYQRSYRVDREIAFCGADNPNPCAVERVVFLGVGFPAVLSLVAGIVQFDDDDDVETFVEDRVVDVLLRNFASGDIDAFSGCDQGRHCDLRKNPMVGKGLGNQLEDLSFGKGHEFVISEVVRNCGIDVHGRLPKYVDDVEIASYQGHAAHLIHKDVLMYGLPNSKIQFGTKLPKKKPGRKSTWSKFVEKHEL